MMIEPDWPEIQSHGDLAIIEAIPIEERGLPTSTYELIKNAERRWPEATALTLLPSAERWRSPAVWTFADLAHKVRAIANVFAAQGVTRGEAVTLMSANTGLLLAATLAAQAAGIAAPVNPDLGTERICVLARRARSSVIVAAGPELDLATWGSARDVAAAIGARALYALRPDGTNDDAPPLAPLEGTAVAYLEEAMRAVPNDVLTCIEPTGDAIASYFHTGGTTGDPKLAAHTQHSEIVMAWSLALMSQLPREDAVLAGLPLFHVNAVLITGLAPLFRGNAVLWIGPAGFRDFVLYQQFWKIIERYRVAAMSAVPTVYAVLNEVPIDADISTLEFAAVGAAPLPDAVRQRFREHTGVELAEGYGLTEATCVSAASRPDIAREKSVGLRMPYQQIVAVAPNDDGGFSQLSPGSVGEIMIKGPSVFAGYVGADGQIDGAGTLPDGGLLTGDLGSVDSDGYLYLTGRAKDVIIRGGHNIDPSTVEDAMLAHPAVSAAAAVGRPDPHVGEVPVVYVVADGTATDKQLLEWAQTNIAERVAVPKDIYRIDAIPVTAIGKPFKPSLRADAAARAMSAALSVAGIDITPFAPTARYHEGSLSISITGLFDPTTVSQIEAVASRLGLKLAIDTKSTS